MEYLLTPMSEITNRITALQQLMQHQQMDGMFILQRADLFYFTGTAQDAFLYIPVDGPPLLMVRRFYPRARAESAIQDIVEIPSVKQIPRIIIDRYGTLPKICAMELDVLPVKDFRFYRKLFNTAKTVDGSALILKVRQIKSAYELDLMENTAARSAQTFEYMKSIISDGLSEMEFAARFEVFARKIGHAGHLRVRHFQSEGYAWHVLSGKNGSKVGLLDSPASGEGTSPAFPCGAGVKRLKTGEPIMVDMAWMCNGYHMDETRMFALGSMPPKALEASGAVREIHDAVIAAARPGVAIADLFDLSVRMAGGMGYADQFLGPPGYKVKFIGHGIGVELIESPIMAKGSPFILESGMTFALEPKMVFKDEFGVGIESVIQVTRDAAVLISRVPPEVFIC
ncbi:MAG: aminopeptidase P family protein [Desulfobacteraceae bacterium]|nr:aminopeptidase P family protein [Desulfobacteraceae bacterium]